VDAGPGTSDAGVDAGTVATVDAGALLDDGGSPPLDAGIATPDAGDGSDAAANDAGTPSPDAGAAPNDAGNTTPPGNADAATTPERSEAAGGCGCSVPGSTPRETQGSALTAFALLLTSRRRRRGRNAV
jgi:MYXO-CTERM domain-containing protein